MTEEEAKTKNCCGPVGSGVATGACQWVESDDVEYVVMWPTRLCTGSACMAWRWLHKAGKDENDQPNYYAGPWQGYCGLAGRP
jgi:hypothetical protein